MAVTPVQTAASQPTAAQAEQNKAFEKVSLPPPPQPADAPTSLLTETVGDGSANCLEDAATIARDGRDQLVFLGDDSGSPGHVVVQDRATGAITDPTALTGQARAPNLAGYISRLDGVQGESGLHVQGVANAEEVHKILSLPPQERAGAIERLSPDLRNVENRLYAQPGGIIGANQPGQLGALGQVMAGLAASGVIARNVATNAGQAIADRAVQTGQGAAALGRGAAYLGKVGLYTASLPFLAIGQSRGWIQTDANAQPFSINAPINFNIQNAIGTAAEGGQRGGYYPSLFSLISATKINAPSVVGGATAGLTQAFLQFGFPKDGNFDARATAALGRFGPMAANYARNFGNEAWSLAAGSLATYATDRLMALGSPPNADAPSPGPSRGLKSIDDASVEVADDATKITEKGKALIDEYLADPATRESFERLAAQPDGAQVIGQMFAEQATSDWSFEETQGQLDALKQSDPAAYEAYMAKVGPSEERLVENVADISAANQALQTEFAPLLTDYLTQHPNATAEDYVASLTPQQQSALEGHVRDLQAGVSNATANLDASLNAWNDVAIEGENGDVIGVSELSRQIVQKGSSDDAYVNYKELRKGLEGSGFNVEIDDKRLEYMIKDVYGGADIGALGADQVADMIQDGGISLAEGKARMYAAAPMLSDRLAQTIVEKGSESRGWVSNQVDREQLKEGLKRAGFDVELSDRQLDLLYTTYNTTPGLLSTDQLRTMIQDGGLGFDGKKALINPNAPAVAEPLAKAIIANGSTDDDLVNYKELRKGLDALGFYVDPSDGELEDLIKKVYGEGQTALDDRQLANLLRDQALVQVDGKLENTWRDEL